MSVDQVNDYGVGDNNFTSFQETLDTTRRGKSSITLSNYDNDSAPVVKVGSWFESAGALLEVVSSDETPTGYGSVATSSEFWLYFDSTATTTPYFYYDDTAPTWSNSKQGWYSSTVANDRALFSMYKDSGGTLYQEKYLLTNQSDKQIGELKMSGKTKWRLYYKASAVTAGTIYNNIESWVPNVGDGRPVTGSNIVSSNPISITGIYRSGATTVVASGIDMTNGNGVTVNYSSGGVGSLDIEIMATIDEIT